MRAVCVDHERQDLEDTVSRVRELPQIEDAKGFVRARDALDWLEENEADLALLDIGMPEMNGMELAAVIRSRWPNMAVVFLTAHPEYALEAFRLHVSGYLLKPAASGRLEEEIAYLAERKLRPAPRRIVMRTFGNFDCFVDGRAISFRQAKCKELLAYLVDRNGGSVTRAEAFAVLWEDRLYDRPMQKQLDVIIRSLRATLRDCGAASVLEMKSGMLRLRTDLVDCDLYRFLSGDRSAINEFRGQYMSGYSWAELTEGYLTGKTET